MDNSRMLETFRTRTRLVPRGPRSVVRGRSRFVAWVPNPRPQTGRGCSRFVAWFPNPPPQTAAPGLSFGAPAPNGRFTEAPQPKIVAPSGSWNFGQARHLPRHAALE